MGKVRTLSSIEEILRSLYAELNQKYSVSKLGVFGSYVRDQQREDSDLDILVAFDEPPSLFKFIELEDLLSDLLGVKVDLVMEEAIKPNLKNRILQEVQLI